MDQAVEPESVLVLVRVEGVEILVNERSPSLAFFLKESDDPARRFLRVPIIERSYERSLEVNHLRLDGKTLRIFYNPAF